MLNVRIAGYGKFLPESKVKFYSSRFGNAVRYRAGDLSQIDMLKAASEAALKDASCTIDDIDLIVSATATPYCILPSTASFLNAALNPTKPVASFDINSSCSSFITAFNMASVFLNSGVYKRILIASGDMASTGINERQKESYELFSDAAAAVVLEKCPDGSSCLIAHEQKTYKEGLNLTTIQGGGSKLPSYDYDEAKRDQYLFDMKAKEILFVTARELPKEFDSFLEKNNITLDDIDLIIPHQASQALSMFMQKLKVPKDKYMDRVCEYGNMVSASVPFMLTLAKEEGLIHPGSKVLLIATAAGFNINLMYIKI